MAGHEGGVLGVTGIQGGLETNYSGGLRRAPNVLSVIRKYAKVSL